MINISIVTYKTDHEELENVIIKSSSSDVVNKILIVDNSPTQDIKGLCDKFSNIEYFHNPSNPGYGASHNHAIKQTIDNKIDYHLVLNSDVDFQPDIFNTIIDAINKFPDAGLIAPKVLNEDGTIQYNCKLLPTPMNMFLRALLPKRLRKKSDSLYELRQSGYNSIFRAPFVSGCFMLLNCNALKSSGLFDERFFMYAEDIDLSRRIFQNHSVLFVNNIKIVHQYGGASHKSWRMFLVHSKNMALYFNKWGWFKDDGRKKINDEVLNQFEK